MLLPTIIQKWTQQKQDLFGPDFIYMLQKNDNKSNNN